MLSEEAMHGRVTRTPLRAQPAVLAAEPLDDLTENYEVGRDQGHRRDNSCGDPDKVVRSLQGFEFRSEVLHQERV
jgi:hypothetical protein